MTHLIYAPNVRAGGGLALLQALLGAWDRKQKVRAVLDSRLRDILDIPDGMDVEWCQAGLVSRLRTELALRSVPQNTYIFCFHGLPPLFRLKVGRCNVALFLQNRILLETTSLRQYPLKSRLRLKGERWLFKRNLQRVGQVVVQSESMRRALRPLLQTIAKPAKIIVAPVVPARPFEDNDDVLREYDFIYPAEGQPHKNHIRLIEAWTELQSSGLSPRLALTLGEEDDQLWSALKSRIDREQLNIVNLGRLSREAMYSAYDRSHALIFPSMTESFGLPLAEAVQRGLPILASELDYVRDTCEPNQTFDPHSPVSIARAVRRHIVGISQAKTYMEAERLWALMTPDAIFSNSDQDKTTSITLSGD